MKLPTTPAELLDLVSKHLQPDEQAVAAKNYRYVIYARKSTDDKEKQARSLPDQIQECKDFAERSELKLGDPDVIQEAESAKLPDTRPGFRQMIDEIKAGKYDGILAWHPDRLARNMKDAGEIIDLLDKGVIKDLKFSSFHFQNDANGKMVLGITFVLSKTYTDQLSLNVSRGNRHSVEEGKYPNKAKHGYFKDSEGFLRPDGNNFVLIKTAFRLRLEGRTLDEIATYLNKNAYQRFEKDGSHSLFKWNKQNVDEHLMRDTVYCGVLVYGKRGGRVNLIEAYNFEPALSVPDFMRIHAFTKDGELVRLARKYRKGQDVKADLARGMITCGDCSSTIYAGITTKATKITSVGYFYFRCENKDCLQYGKSTRANVLVSYVREFLSEKPFSSPEGYDHYAKEMERVSVERVAQTRTLLTTLKTRLAKLENKLTQIREVLTGNDSEDLKEGYRGDYKKTSEEAAEIRRDIARTEKISTSRKAVALTYAEFLELFDKMAERLGKTSKLHEVDFVIRKLFSNFTLKGKKIVNSTLAAPFDALYELKVSSSGHERI